MKFDLSLQQYVEWEVKNVMPIKGKYGYRVILKYMDGSERPQQNPGSQRKRRLTPPGIKRLENCMRGLTWYIPM